MTTVLEPLAEATAPRNPNEITIDNFDYEAAHQEGWTLFNYGHYKDGVPHVQIQKLDKLKATEGGFSSDLDAWTHVVEHARQGSPLHMAALNLVDRRERLGITAHCGTW